MSPIRPAPHSQILVFLMTAMVACRESAAASWTTYEEPVQLAVPNSDGVYEFELELRPKLTMSIPLPLGEPNERSILDYDPQQMAWLERDKNQLGPCVANRTLIDESEVHRSGRAGYAHRADRLLAGLSQHLGTHVRLVAVNGMSPGPPLVVPFGAEVLVRVRSRLMLDSVTLHVHGLDMAGAWFNGGVAYVQQCPILPNSDFSFRFAADRVGTHWYHGEYPYHTASGLLGAFVVLPPESDQDYEAGDRVDSENGLIEGKAGYDRDYVVLLQDWPVSSSEEQHEQFSRMTTRWAYEFDGESAGGREPYCLRPGELNGVPNYESLPLLGLLVNAKGWHSQRDIRTRPSKLPLTTYSVSTGDRVRLRMIHGGYDVPLLVHIEDHRLTVVATDGTPVKPVTVDRLMVFPGERYDLRIDVTRRPTRKTYRIVVRTEDTYYQPGEGQSDGEDPPYWSPQYAKSTHTPIYGLANLELADVAFHPDRNDDVDFEQIRSCPERVANPVPSRGSTTTEGTTLGADADAGGQSAGPTAPPDPDKCVMLNCLYARIPRGRAGAVDARRYECVTADALQRDTDAPESDLLASRIHLDGFEEHLISVDPNSDVDGRIFVEPPRPLLFGDRNHYGPSCEQCGNLSATIYKGRPCRCFTYWRFQPGNIVQLTLYSMWRMTVRRKFTHVEPLNIVGRAVSFHLHGTHFYVVRMGFPELHDNFTVAQMNADLACPDNEIGCLTNRWSNSTWQYGNIPGLNHQATLKDTVVVPYGGYVTIRFRASNRGWWLAETMSANYNDRGTKFAYAVGADAAMPPAPDDFPADCGPYDVPGFPEP